ncbi:alpha/beta-hydrolase [Lophiostoma macrostomum CBS 122681]|uniref:Alpha/beta-hydrolase n=1 Tax=Lophiostoma macrostomum CBS 122681 TaxID=1314788 RepID=A0A6A6TEX1_9PLEO|nr:alpha/beta-hydrolase [Lophiostoma macrostomum CBS 122681]
MAPSISSVLLLVFAGLATAKQCQNFTIPVDITARQGKFLEIPLEGNLDATTFSQLLTQNGANYTATLLQGYQTLQGSYNISAKYCIPDNEKPGPIVQVLSHGIGFDKSYWDLSYNNYNYSYVEVATDYGYSTLAIDRLGIGASSHGDPWNEIQAVAEVEALNAVTTKLRRGEIPQIKNKFSKVVHVGHSFGSVESYWLSALYPSNTDGLILTGYSTASFITTTIAAWNLHIARLNQPYRLGDASPPAGFGFEDLEKGLQALAHKFDIGLSDQDIWNTIATTEVSNLIQGYNETICPLNYSSGYLTWSDLTANQFTFLWPGRYDIGLGLVAEATKQPVTPGEILTIGSAPKTSPFNGPVLVFTGEYDQPFCGGNCYAASPSIPAQAKAQFPKASAFVPYIQPHTAHGLNVHYNATAGYKYIQSFLSSHGLAAA